VAWLILYGPPVALALWLGWTILRAPSAHRGRMALLGLLLAPCVAVLALNAAFGSGADPGWLGAAPPLLFGLGAVLVLILVLATTDRQRARTAVFGAACLGATALPALTAYFNLNQAYL
jgi:hypothetical protein